MFDPSRQRPRNQLAQTLMAIVAALVVIALAASIMYVLLPATTITEGSLADRAISAPQTSVVSAAREPAPVKPKNNAPASAAPTPRLTATEPAVTQTPLHPSATAQVAFLATQTLPTAAAPTLATDQPDVDWTPATSLGAPPAAAPADAVNVPPQLAKTLTPAPSATATASPTATRTPTPTAASSQSPALMPTVEATAANTPKPTIVATEPPAPWPPTATAAAPSSTTAAEPDNVISAPKAVASPLAD